MIIVFNLMNIDNIDIVTGVGQHQLNIIEGIIEASIEKNFVFIVNENVNKQLKSLYKNIITYNYGRQEKIIKVANKFYSSINFLYLNNIIFPRIVKKLKPDIIFQSFNCFTIRTKLKIPVVTMVVDLYHRFYRKYLNRIFYGIVVYKHNRIFKNSYSIITSSYSNREHINRFYPNVINEKINVVPVPISIDTDLVSEYKIKKPYIICVNSLRYHKNIITLIKAYNILKKETDIQLVLVGTEQEDEVGTVLNKEKGIIFTGYISKEQRNYLYKNAALFVSPTMFEGFGMTPIEAMLFKVKVLVSDIEVMRESTFNSVFYYKDIMNEKNLSKRIIEVLNINISDEQLEDIKQKALELYAPIKIAQDINNVFMKVYSENKWKK